MHKARAAGRRVYGEATVAREEVEHAGPLGHLADTNAVIALVEEVTGLLAAHHIGLEVQTVLEEGYGLGDSRPVERDAFGDALG